MRISPTHIRDDFRTDARVLFAYAFGRGRGGPLGGAYALRRTLPAERVRTPKGSPTTPAESVCEQDARVCAEVVSDVCRADPHLAQAGGTRKKPSFRSGAFASASSR